MKKRGFTLAEILVALGVVGVVSALSLPTFVSNTSSKAHKSTIEVSKNSIENAIGTVFAQDAANTIGESTLGDAGTTADFVSTLNEYLKSGSTTYNPLSGGQAIQLKNGSVASFNLTNSGAEYNQIAGTVVIDSNGISAPNSNNIDIYTFNLMGNGNLEKQ